MQTNRIATGLLASTLTLGALGAATVAGAATTTKVTTPVVHALFVETDQLTANHILTYVRGNDGTISIAGNYLTGGKGGLETGAVADPLASQGGVALINGGATLVATNAGSNTISVFAVNGTALTLEQQLPSGGTFPTSIASHGNDVAVLNAGGAGSVAEFALANGKLSAISGEVRSLGLSNTNPPNFLQGPGQVGYTPNGQHLVVATKKSTSSFEVFSVSKTGVLGATATITASNNPVPFAFNFDAAGRLVDVEAGNSSLNVYTVNANGTLTSVGSIADGQKALCWLSEAQGYFFGSNAGSANVTSFAEATDGTPSVLTTVAGTTHAGTTDSVVSPDGKTLYVESGAAGTIDAFTVGSNGSLTQVETLYNIPVASEGLAVS